MSSKKAHKSSKIMPSDSSNEILTQSFKSGVPAFSFKIKKTWLPKKTNVFCNEPISVTPEYDSLHSKRSKEDHDRSYWDVELMRRHSDINDLVTRVDPVSRAVTLSGLFLPDRRLQPHENILSLISQHLKMLGLAQTAMALDHSFQFPITHPIHLPYSQLLYHLERGVFNSDRFWCLLLPTATYPTAEKDIKKQLVTQCSAALGVIGGQSMSSTPISEDTVESLQGLELDPQSHYPVKGTINQLVWAVARRWDPSFPPSFVDAFVMTYHGYMSSTMLLQKLKEAWEMFDKAQLKGNDQAELQFVKLVEKWIDMSFFDFDSALIQSLSQWLNSIEMNKPAAKKRMLEALRKAIENERSEAKTETSLKGIEIPKNLFLNQFELTELDPTELARQITMHTGQYYYQISPKELLDCAWSKPSIMHRAPNVIGVTNCFNRISNWAVYTVLFGDTIQGRLRKWKFFADLADALWKMNNFLDSVAIAMGLNSSPVYRLTQHKALAGDTLKPLERILMVSSKEHGAELIEIETEYQKKGEAIPFVATFLGQLTFTYDGNPDQLEGLVNFTKCVLVFNLIDKILSFKTKEFHFAEIEQIQNKLMNLPEADENELYARSLEIEPQGITFDDFKVIDEKEKAAQKALEKASKEKVDQNAQPAKEGQSEHSQSQADNSEQAQSSSQAEAPEQPPPQEKVVET